MRRTSFLVAVSSLACCAQVMAQTAPQEDYMVLESNVPAYAVNSIVHELPKADSLPLGGYVRVLNRSGRGVLITNFASDRDTGGTREIHPESRPGQGN